MVKKLMIVGLVAVCLICSLFMMKPTSSMLSVSNYNPYADINNDGVVDIYDAILLAGSYNTNGTALPRANVVYDSGWINITDRRGQDLVITHNLNRTDLTLDIATKASLDGPEQKCYGLKTVEGWQQTYGGPAFEEIHSVIKTKDGGYALGGDTNEYGYAFYFVKTDANGNMQWSKTYGENGMYRIYADVVQTSDGGYALAGYKNSYSAGGLDYWLVKTDENGNALWNRTYGGPGDEIAFALIQTSDGGYVLGGKSDSFGQGYDIYIVKTNSTGDVEWAHNYGGSQDDVMWTPSTILETNDGGLIFAGETKSYGAGNGDIWLIKTDMQGNTLWNMTYGGVNEESSPGLIRTADGGYLMVGSTSSYGAGNSDVWLVKVDAAGNPQWNKTYGGSGTDVGMSVVQTPDGGYAVGAISNSFGLGGWDAWLIRTDSSGNKLWDRVYGGAGDDELYTVLEVTNNVFVIGGDTSSLGAGNLDGWLMQTSAENGLAWKDTTPNSITFFRPLDEIQCNYVRIRLLEIS